MKVPIVDLSGQYKEIKKAYHKAIAGVFQHSDFILGQEVRLFEQEFADYCGVKYGVGLNSGTDALFLSLRALGIGRDDEVIVPVFTFIATALAVSLTGAKPVFVDIDEKTYNIDAQKIEKAISKKTKAIVPVHLYGQPADMAEILKIAKRYKIKVIEDAAQAHGALYRTKKAGSLGDIGCFSFYPTKNLGAAGDGGMAVTNDKHIYEDLLKLRDYGRTSRYEHKILGYNSRLDSLQAVALRLKLRKLDKWNKMRQGSAQFYTSLFKGAKGIITPSLKKDRSHVYHLYVVRVNRRDKVMEQLKEKDIGILIHYPIALHLQPCYVDLGYQQGDFPIAEKITSQIITLPMFPHLKKEQIEYVVKALKEVTSNA